MFCTGAQAFMDSLMSAQMNMDPSAEDNNIVIIGVFYYQIYLRCTTERL
jgi:hypothetical protein